MHIAELKAFLIESNKIEGIIKRPDVRQLQWADKFLGLDKITIPDLENIVNVFQPGATLRDKVGMDVRVGRHVPLEGGPQVRQCLNHILIDLWVDYGGTPYGLHHDYETLHPFMDGNGRSGRMLWLWQMLKLEKYSPALGFLRTWYYQSLDGGR